MRFTGVIFIFLVISVVFFYRPERTLLQNELPRGDIEVVSEAADTTIKTTTTNCGAKGCTHNPNDLIAPPGSPVSACSPVGLRHLKPGQSLFLPSSDGEIPAIVEHVWDGDIEEKALRGRLTGSDGGLFWIKWKGQSFTGMIQIPGRNLAYEIAGADITSMSLRETTLSSLLCVIPTNGRRTEPGEPVIYGLPRPTNRTFAARSSGDIRTTAIPVLQSRPGTPRVIYLDFDGEVVNDAAWSSSTINAAPARMNNSQITEAWRRVVADFDSFDVNITTVRSDFDNAPTSSRTHVIITATDTAAPGAGGVAYLNSFTGSSSRYCWAFIDDNAKDCAEVISHEVGHTLNLNHDGRISPSEEYYEGHGSGNTGWAPIMGVGYYQSLVQWSKGDYPNANRTNEDDLQIIAGKLPYLADDHGNATSNATAVVGSSIAGRIERTNDVDIFRLELANETYTIDLQPVDYGNLDALLEILNAGGSVIATANLPNEIFASATFTLATPQTVYVRVRGTGKSANGTDFGYPAYSSLGSYTLGGFGNQQQPPSPPGAVSLRIISGSQLEVSWPLVAGASSYEVYRHGTFLLATNTALFVDRHLTPGASYSYQVKSVNAFGASDLSASANITTPAPDAFVMDGAADFSGYLISNPGMVIHAAVRSNRLYVSTWSPGDNGAGSSDHHVLISDVLLGSATTPNPWAKAGLMAIPGNKPYLAGESSGTYAGWANASGTTTLFKGPSNSLQLEGSIDLIANFGAVPATLYLAAVAFATEDNGGINAQAPAGNSNNNLEPGEFLAVPVAAIRDRALDGDYDILSSQRDFVFESIGTDGFGRPQFNGLVIPGLTYSLHRSTNLLTPPSAWPGVVTSSVPAGNFFLNITDPLPVSEKHFYQLRWRR